MTFEEWHEAHYPEDVAILKMHEEGSPLMAVEVIGARISKRDRKRAFEAGREAMRGECVKICEQMKSGSHWDCADELRKLK